MPESYTTKTDATRRRNIKKYKQFPFRVRRGSHLDDHLGEFLLRGDTSLNFLITKLLCKHFKCDLPHREYDTFVRHTII